MKEVKSIDRSKKVNRRCVNCIHWKEKHSKTVRFFADKGLHCDVGGKDIAYWNCCSHFEWDPDKTYVN